MKKSAVIGKKQIVLSVLAVTLAVAVFLNWKLTATQKNISTDTAQKGEYLGAAQYVNTTVSNQQKEETSQSESKDGYFTSARHDREEARKKQKTILKEITENLKSDEASKKKAQDDLNALAKACEVEANIETLVKAKGFSRCLAIVNGDQVSVIVAVSDGLVASQTVQIQDIVLSQMKISLENIKILEIN